MGAFVSDSAVAHVVTQCSELLAADRVCADATQPQHKEATAKANEKSRVILTMKIPPYLKIERSKAFAIA